MSDTDYGGFDGVGRGLPDEIDHPPLGKTELRAWYIFDWSNSVYSQVVIGAFLPLLLQSAAKENAGFPGICSNYFVNQTLANGFFNTTSDWDGEPDFFYDNKCASKGTCQKSCVDPEISGISDTVCPGIPSNGNQCLTVASGYLTKERVVVAFGSIDLVPFEYATWFIAFSVLFQIPSFISVGTLGDYGRGRKKWLVIFSVAGSISCVLCITVNADLWWLGGVFMIVSNVCYGVSYVLYNSWLPMLARKHWDVIDVKDAEEREQAFVRTVEQISNTGFSVGYGGAWLCLLIVPAPVVYFSESIFGGTSTEALESAYRMSVAFAGAWWFFFSLYTFKHLKTRPGPPLPEGASPIKMAWSETWTTLKQIKQLKKTFYFVLLWFMLSDGVFIISTVGVLFMSEEVVPKYLSASTGVLLFVAILPAFVLLGVYFHERILTKRWKWSAKKILTVDLILVLVMPAYGILGVFDESLGFQYVIECIGLGAWYALFLGSIQTYARSIFVRLIPPGYESRFFAFYEITNKGSGVIGPIATAISARNGETRLVFIYIFFMIFVPTCGLRWLDVDEGEKEAVKFAEDNPIDDPSTKKIEG